MKLAELRDITTRYPLLTIGEANDMHKTCANCGRLTPEGQLVDDPEGLVCLACSTDSLLLAMKDLGIDEAFGEDFPRVVAL